MPFASCCCCCCCCCCVDWHISGCSAGGSHISTQTWPQLADSLQQVFCRSQGGGGRRAVYYHCGFGYCGFGCFTAVVR
jgi:hypothetical protein